jgi:type IV secretory pathway TrbD component
MKASERIVIYLMAAVLGFGLGWWLAYTIGVTL